MTPHIQDTKCFEELYKNAKENSEHIPWAKLTTDPFLIEYLQTNYTTDKKALVIGCGLADDAKAISDAGYKTHAFDISKSAIKWAKKRFINDDIEFKVADIFKLDDSYHEKFDFVFESLTIQSLPITYRPQMIEAISKTLAPNGKLLVIANGKNEGETFNSPPYPLLRNDLGLFEFYGLKELEFSIYPEDSTISSLKYRAIYTKES